MEYFCVSLTRFKKWYRKLSCNSRMKIQRMSYFFVNLPTQWICYFIVNRLTTSSTKYKNKHLISYIYNTRLTKNVWFIYILQHNRTLNYVRKIRCDLVYWSIDTRQSQMKDTASSPASPFHWSFALIMIWKVLYHLPNNKI